MPFNNEIAGGNGSLVRNWIQSVGYTAGSVGWRISKDGSAEFNNGTFRGSIEVGSLSGQHFYVNNPNTTDVIDIYNSANKLVFIIDNTGRLSAISSVNNAEVVINGGSLFFEDLAQTPNANIQLTGIITADSTLLSLFGGKPHNYAGAGQGAFIDLNTGDTTASEWINVEQRGIQGAMVQTDQSTNANQLFHVATYNVTTDAGGSSTFNHGAAFTPTEGFLAGVNGIGANFPYQYAWFANPFTSTTAKAAFKDNLGAALANTTLGVMGFFVG